jgi:hypothetical protein
VSDAIFLVRGGEELVQLRPTGYPNEDLLQELIAKFPGVLAGEEGGVPNRWLLVGREAGLPDTEDGSDRWAVDHLFLDQDAVPTLVEVKLARDTRIRREVVGQMLDYASNAVVYWPIERLRELFLRQCQQEGHDPDQLLAQVAGPEADPEVFWGQADENLRAGRLRLVFVADEIPRELRRIIEFLNGQMSADVIGIEVKQYLGDELTTLVPKVIGQTAEAEARKRRSPGRATRQWDADSFFAVMAEKRPAAEVAVARTLFELAGERGWQPMFGSGRINGSWLPTLQANGHSYRPFALYTNGVLAVAFEPLANRPPFDQQETRLELLRHLNQISGVSIDALNVDRYQTVPLATIAADANAPSLFGETLDWLESVAAAG